MSGFYDEASWVLIPEGIKEDVVYAQKPTDGLGDLTFTRASDATRTNSAGVIERTPWNLVTFSEMFTDASWTKTRSTVTANTITAPNGTPTADTITANVGTATNYFVDFTTATGTGNFTASIFAKKGSVDWLYIRQGNSAGGTSLVRAWFDLNTGTIGSTSPAAISHSIEDYGNGWYRCSMTFSVLSGGLPRPQFYLSTGDGVATFDSDGSQFFYLWGAQLVEGTDAKPYFATTNRQDVPRLDYRNADGSVSTCPRLLLEPQRTNSIRNSTMVGAVAGSPGTLPTNWLESLGGLTRQVVGVGTENGIQYVDLRFSGTATDSLFRLFTEASNQIVASNGQTWTTSNYIKVVAAPSPPSSYLIEIFERTAAGAFVTSGGAAIVPTSNLERFTFTRTLVGGATVERTQPTIRAVLVPLSTYDFTIRIAAPQMELGAYATTFVPTTTAAVTRLVDTSSLGNIYTNGLLTASGGTWFIDLNDTSERIRAASVGFTLSVSGTDYIEIRNTSTALTRPTIRFIVSSTSTGGFTLTANNSKIAINWNGTVGNIFVNGVKVISNASFTPLALQTLSLTGAGVATSINQSAFFPVPLTDAQCITLTT